VYKPARPGELFKSFLNNKKAATILGWKPAVRLSAGLAATIAYFKNK
jgi:UDP-glucose 4-epimerase